MLWALTPAFLILLLKEETSPMLHANGGGARGAAAGVWWLARVGQATLVPKIATLTC